jgi:soluble lytic murein transglycosylase-like protein
MRLLLAWFFLFGAFTVPAWAETGTASPLHTRQELYASFFTLPCAKYKVPKSLALAIARQESGIQPWALNIAGRSYRPKTKAEAVKIAQEALEQGRSFDVGIMQINSYWIKKYDFPLEQLLEPANNIKVGVWILAHEIKRHGLNWTAVAYYHTPVHKNPQRGQHYAALVNGHLKKVLQKH